MADGLQRQHRIDYIDHCDLLAMRCALPTGTAVAAILLLGFGCTPKPAAESQADKPAPQAEHPVPEAPEAPAQAKERSLTGQGGDVESGNLHRLLRVWQQNDLAHLTKVSEAEAATPNERAFASYLVALSEKPQSWDSFLRAFPRDAESLEWLSLKAGAAFPESELATLCGSSAATCSPISMSDRLVTLAAEGNRLAVQSFVQSWLTHSDGGVSEWVCQDLVPKIMKAAAAPLLEEAARGAKATKALKVCVDFAMAGALSKEEIEAIEGEAVSGQQAQTLLKAIVQRLRNPNPDWP